MMATKHEKLWANSRRDFLINNPPNHQGYYECYLCFKWIPASEITVDHIIPRSRAPHLRYVPSNFALCCGACNTSKGSKVVKNLPKKTEKLEDIW